jgi:hypothetical protein
MTKTRGYRRTKQILVRYNVLVDNNTDKKFTCFEPIVAIVADDYQMD